MGNECLPINGTNFYEVLGVAAYSLRDQIKEAYQKLNAVKSANKNNERT